MAIVSSTYVKRPRNGRWDIIESHTDSLGVVHSNMIFMDGDATDQEIEAKVQESAQILADRLAEAELEGIFNND